MRSAEAKRKILDVATAIEAEPHRYRQSWWASIRVDDLDPDIDNDVALSPDNCTMAFCIAGWNHLLHHVADDWLELGHYFDEEDGEWQPLNWTRNGYQLTDEVIADFELRDDPLRELMISSHWRPIPFISVPQALWMLAFGASVESITDRHLVEEWRND